MSRPQRSRIRARSPRRALPRVAAKLLVGLAAAVAVLSAFVSPAAAASAPGLPANTGCDSAAVVAKLSVLEDRAAANMLAEALDALDPRTDSRCLVDAGNPADGSAPSSAARAEVGRASTVYVVGGPAALSDAWLRDRLGLDHFIRVAGANRWDTQANVAVAIISLARNEAVSSYDSTEASRGNPPSNSGCYSTAVLAKLSVREDRAAANMLTEALSALSADRAARCLIDAGNPERDRPVQPTGADTDLAARSTGAYIVGGTSALPAAWIEEHFSVGHIARVSGRDRWSTQARVAQEIVTLARGGPRPHQYIDGEGNLVSVYDDDIFVQRNRKPGGIDAASFPPVDGQVTITVRYCGPESELRDTGQPTADARERDAAVAAYVADFNRYISPYFRHQSSNEVQFVFLAGESLVVADNDQWDRPLGSFKNDPEDGADEACWNKADAGTYLLIDQPTDGGAAGWAVRGSRKAIQPIIDRFQNRKFFYNVIAHEIGHAWLNLCHPHNRDPDKNCLGGHLELVADPFPSAWVEDSAGPGRYEPNITGSDIAKHCSIMSYCSHNFYVQDYDPVSTAKSSWIACGQRVLLGWATGPVTPSGVCAPSDGGVAPTSPLRASQSVRVGDSSLTVAWKAPNGLGGSVEHYELELSTADGALIAQTETSILMHRFSGLANDVSYVVEVRAVNRYGTSSPLRLVGVPKSSRVVPSVSEVRLWRGEQNAACSSYRDIAQCAWLDIDVDFVGDGLPASVDVTCHTLHYDGERPWVTTSVTLRSDRIALDRGRSSELDRVCNYALPGNYVYVTVNGVRSENLYWAEVESDANASAVLRKGDSARGERRTLSGGACSAACRWLDVTVTGLRPNTQYEMWCRTHGLGSDPITQTGYYFGTKGFDFTSDAQGNARITRGCFFNFMSVIWADIDANPDDAFNSIVASSNKIAVTPGTVHPITGALTREPVWADGSCDGLRGRRAWSETYSVVCGS